MRRATRQAGDEVGSARWVRSPLHDDAPEVDAAAQALAGQVCAVHHRDGTPVKQWVCRAALWPPTRDGIFARMKLSIASSALHLDLASGLSMGELAKIAEAWEGST